MDVDNPDNILVILQLLLSCVANTLVVYQTILKKPRRRPRRWWVRPIYQNRKQQGDYHNLVREMRLYDTEMFFHYTRCTIEQFDNLLSIVGPLLIKRSNREPLNPEHRLLITLRFLATGSSQQTLAFQFRAGKSTICNVLSETCLALWDALEEKVFMKPSEANWLQVAKDFFTKWNFPHCIGALDGKHFRVQCPPNSGSEYHNYKKYFSIVLLALCDANYKFTVVDIGGMGSESDGGLFSRSLFGKLLEQKKMYLPPPSYLGNIGHNIPYFLVADEAFPLKDYLMRPYPGKYLCRSQQIFNYRLSRARRIIENTFGILVSRWRLFQGPIIAKLENIERYILAAICLHNFLKIDEEKKTKNDHKYCPPQYIDTEINGKFYLGEWRNQIFDSQFFNSLNRTGSNNAKRSFFCIRDSLCEYFMTPEGAVPWQEQSVFKGVKRKR